MRRRGLAGLILGGLALLASAPAEACRRGSSSGSTHRSRGRSSGSTYTAPAASGSSRSTGTAQQGPAQPNTPASPVQCTALAPCTGPDGARYFMGSDGVRQFLR